MVWFGAKQFLLAKFISHVMCNYLEYDVISCLRARSCACWTSSAVRWTKWRNGVAPLPTTCQWLPLPLNPLQVRASSCVTRAAKMIRSPWRAWRQTLTQSSDTRRLPPRSWRHHLTVTSRERRRKWCRVIGWQLLHRLTSSTFTSTVWRKCANRGRRWWPNATHFLLILAYQHLLMTTCPSHPSPTSASAMTSLTLTSSLCRWTILQTSHKSFHTTHSRDT